MTSRIGTATLLLLLAAFGAACSEGGDGTGSGPHVERFMSGLPLWRDFAPPTLDERMEGAERVDDARPRVVEEVTVDNPANGTTDSPTTITKVCTTESVDFHETPGKYVMFEPPTNILYPGALVVGASLRDGASSGDILPIDVAQRNPIEVTIRACGIPNNSRTVQPTLAAVNSAVASIIFEAKGLGENCESPTGSFRIDTFRNEDHFALSAGISGRYLGFSGSASGSHEQGKGENSVAATFTESLYTVDVSAPQSPRDWFSSDFTPELLQAQIDQGTMDSDNVPAYVARITYGRMMVMTMTSTHSEADMRAALEFKYENPVAEVDGEASIHSSTVRNDSSISIAYIGGNESATASMIQSEDWTRYFDESAAVAAEDALPISIEIRSVRDNVPAVVQELTSYDRQTCFDAAGERGTYRFLAEQHFTPGFSSPGQVVAMGDVDGADGDDIVWAATGFGSRGELAVAFSDGDGTFTLRRALHPGMAAAVGEVDLLVTDVDDDDRDDIVINVRRSTEDPDANMVYVTFYKGGSAGDGAEFVHSAPQSLGDGGGWADFVPHEAQIDNLHGGDIVWTNALASSAENTTRVATAVDTRVPGFDLRTERLFATSDALDAPAGAYEYAHVADFDGDGHDDVVWHDIDEGGNRYVAARGTPDGLELEPGRLLGRAGWAGYAALAGDVTGDGRADLVDPRVRDAPASEPLIVWIFAGSDVSDGSAGPLIGPDGGRDFGEYRDEWIATLLDGDPSPDVYLADVDGNGTKDLLLNVKGSADDMTNSLGVGLGIVGGLEFSFHRPFQSHPAEKYWSEYRTIVADANGDGREDVLWISSAATNSVHVGLAGGD